MSALVVICTSDIPSSTFECFLDAAETFALDDNDDDDSPEMAMTFGEMMRVCTSRNPEQYIVPEERPLPPLESSFVGDSPDDIRPWFQANRLKFGEFVFGNAFIVLDSQTVEDNSTCFLVVCPSEFEPAQTMRCTFFTAFLDASRAEYESWSAWDGEDDKYKGRFRRSKIVMTENNRNAGMGGRFLSKVNGVWEINQETRSGIAAEDIVVHD